MSIKLQVKIEINVSEYVQAIEIKEIYWGLVILPRAWNKGMLECWSFKGHFLFMANFHFLSREMLPIPHFPISPEPIIPSFQL